MLNPADWSWNSRVNYSADWRGRQLQLSGDEGQGDGSVSEQFSAQSCQAQPEPTAPAAENVRQPRRTIQKPNPVSRRRLGLAILHCQLHSSGPQDWQAC